MKRLTRDERITLAELYLEGGQIGQNRFRWRERDGREMVCALSAFGWDINDSDDCPADLMPEWLSNEIPTIDDGIHASRVPWFAKGLIERAKLWHALGSEDWRNIERAYTRCYVTINPRQVGGDPVKYQQLAERLFTIIDEQLEVNG